MATLRLSPALTKRVSLKLGIPLDRPPASKRARQAIDTLDTLSQRWPSLFAKNGRCWALSTTIFDELQRANPDLSPRHLRLALYLYTHRRSYLMCIEQGGYRYGLDGQRFPITRQEQAHAQRTLAASF